MHIGLFLPSLSPFATPEFLRAYAETAEEHGFHSIWVGEHVVFLDKYTSNYPYADDGRLPVGGEAGMLDLFATLTFLGSVTTRIRLGTGICLVPQRNPVYTAKEVSTLDWLSGGRVDFGIGIGWLSEEFDALEVPFAERAARTRDYLEVIRRLWCDDVSSHEGPYYRLPPCRMYPKPVQQPHPPVYFGGETDAALARVADVGDGWHGFNHTPATAADRVRRLETLLAERGRSLADVDIIVSPYLQPVQPTALNAYRDAGVKQVVLPAFAVDPDGVRETITELGEKWGEVARTL
ncbi:MAG: LLM class F420-dependent oxidoreductase [Acidimicrobiia bacterium]